MTDENTTNNSAAAEDAAAEDAAAEDKTPAAAAYLRVAISGLGIGNQGHPPIAEAKILSQGPYIAANIGNDLGCDMANSVMRFQWNGEDLASKFKTDAAGRDAVVGVLTVHLAIANAQMRSILHEINDPAGGHEAKFVAYNAGCNCLSQIAAVTHAVKDLSGIPTPKWMIDAMIQMGDELSKTADTLVASRDAEPSKTVH